MNEEAQTTVVEPQSKKAAPPRSTEYVVLLKDGEGNDMWYAVGLGITATSARAAVAAHLNTVDDKAGTWIAVPVRSWQPITVEVETQTKLKFS